MSYLLPFRTWEPVLIILLFLQVPVSYTHLDVYKRQEEEEDSGSGLSKGIQNVTEKTANLLASYINAIRADVSVKREYVRRLRCV